MGTVARELDERPLRQDLPAVTISMSVVEWAGTEALYEAKRCGRNRVCMARRSKLRMEGDGILAWVHGQLRALCESL